MSILGKRDVFGLESCFLDQPSSVSARSIDNTRIPMYGKDAIDFFLYERPQISKGILASLLGQLTQTILAPVREES